MAAFFVKPFKYPEIRPRLIDGAFKPRSARGINPGLTAVANNNESAAGILATFNGHLSASPLQKDYTRADLV